MADLGPGPIRVPVSATLGEAYRLTFGRLGGWLALIGVLQGIVLLLAVPGLHAVFGAALQAAGIASLTLDTAARLAAAPGGLALMVLLAVLGLLALVAQATVFLIAAARQQSADGGLPSPRSLIATAAARLRSLLRPSTLLLLPYAFLLVPLAPAAIGSVFSNWIAVPNFVSGELMKTPGGAVAYTLAIAIIGYLNLRLVLTLPFLAVGGLHVPAAMAASWRATGWVPWRLAALLLGVIIPLSAAAVLAAGLGLAATAGGDVAEALGASADVPVMVAAVVSGLLPIVGFALTGLGVALQSHVFVRYVARTRPIAPVPAAAGTPVPVRRTAAVVLPLAAAGVAVLLATQAYPRLDRIDDGGAFVIAHRGAPTVAVENTIPALEAAHAQGADLVEFDTIQTADGDWVVMHDFNLARLAGDPRDTADLTLDELTALTVSTPGGLTAPIPSLRDFVTRAAELGQGLLIEIKPSGRETDDYLDRFFAILDEAGVTDSSLYHSLSAEVVADQKALRPELQVGYIVSVNVGGLPATPADFIVVEEWSYSPELRDAAWDAGKGVLVWTVNDESAMRGYLRAAVDGVISDHPDLLVEAREDIAADRSLAGKLWDAMDRLLVIG